LEARSALISEMAVAALNNTELTMIPAATSLPNRT